jgi:hypothetical protein
MTFHKETVEYRISDNWNMAEEYLDTARQMQVWGIRRKVGSSTNSRIQVFPRL